MLHWTALMLLLTKTTEVYGQLMQAGPALINISGSSGDLGRIRSYLTDQQAPVTSNAPSSSFVKRKGNSLQLAGKPYRFAGTNCYYLLTKAADNSTRNLVTEAFEAAASLGLTVIRAWAFNDGNVSLALQPQLGQLDPAVLSNGLDYVIKEAAKYGIKLILTLTNWNHDYGGMQQYVEWATTNGTMSQFFTDLSIQATYKDYMTGIILRKNSLTGIVYRDDPTILAWDIANEPSNYGDESGDELQSWLEEMSSYVKSIDSNHLVYCGTFGYFGISTPDLLHLNRNHSEMFTPFTQIRWDYACSGNDYARNAATPDIDLASFHLYEQVKLGWTEQLQHQVAGHVDIAAKLEKPLIIDEFDVRRPNAQRNEGLELIYTLIQNSSATVAGSCIWMLASASYPDYDTYTIHLTENATAQPQGLGFPVLQQAAGDAQNAVFRNFDAAVQCVQRRNFQARQDDSPWPFVDDWNDTLSIIRSAAAAVNAAQY